jgi:hypothetical protein
MNILNSFPYIKAYLNSPLTNVTGNGTSATLKFDTIVSGSTSGYSTSTGIFTAPIAGRYLIVTAFTFNNIVNSANGNVSNIQVNSTPYRLAEFSLTAAKTSGNTFVTNGALIINLSVNDTVSVILQVNNGSSASVGVSAGTNPYVTWLYIRYLP